MQAARIHHDIASSNWRLGERANCLVPFHVTHSLSWNMSALMGRGGGCLISFRDTQLGFIFCLTLEEIIVFTRQSAAVGLVLFSCLSNSHRGTKGNLYERRIQLCSVGYLMTQIFFATFVQTWKTLGFLLLLCRHCIMNLQ